MTICRSLIEPGKHERACISRSKRKAFLAFLFSVVLLAVAFRGISKPFAAVREPASVIAGAVCVIGLMTVLVVRITCWRERLWLGIAVIAGTVGLVKGLFPTVVSPAIRVLQWAVVLLWTGATLVSLRFVFSAFRHDQGHQGDPR